MSNSPFQNITAHNEEHVKLADSGYPFPLKYTPGLIGPNAVAFKGCQGSFIISNPILREFRNF